MKNWDEVKTAYQVAKLGTVSGAADALGIHHATVIRHIDSLEARLNVKLFQRHPRGYSATEAGSDLLRVAQATAEQFQQLSGRIRGHASDISGDLIVTSLVENATLLLEAVVSFQSIHPNICVRYHTDERPFRLEYGEAHVALRAGPMPNEPDNIAQRIYSQQMALFASDSYIDQHGTPRDISDLSRHRFVAHDNADYKAPFNRWLRAHVATEQIVFRSTNLQLLEQAVLSGAGIGFLNLRDCKKYQKIQRILPMQKEWASPLWLVTHVDLHRTAKVQAFLDHVKNVIQQEIKTEDAE